VSDDSSSKAKLLSHCFIRMRGTEVPAYWRVASQLPSAAADLNVPEIFWPLILPLYCLSPMANVI